MTPRTVIPAHRHAVVHRRAHRAVRQRSPLLVAVVLTLAAIGVVGGLVLAGPTGHPTPANAAIVVPPVPAPPVVPPVPAASAPVAAPLSPAQRSRCPARSVACVDLVAREAWLQHDGQVSFGPVPILPGAQTGLLPPGPRSSATPTGTFHVQRKKVDEFSGEFHEPMPHAVYFAPGGIAFHEGSLTETSNGCVHLDDAASRAFFGGLRIGDGVTVF